MITESTISFIGGFILLLMGWVLKLAWQKIETVENNQREFAKTFQDFSNEIKNLSIIIAGGYVKKEEFERSIDKLANHVKREEFVKSIDKLNSRLDDMMKIMVQIKNNNHNYVEYKNGNDFSHS